MCTEVWSRDVWAHCCGAWHWFPCSKLGNSDRRTPRFGRCATARLHSEGYFRTGVNPSLEPSKRNVLLLMIPKYPSERSRADASARISINEKRRVDFNHAESSDSGSAVGTLLAPLSSQCASRVPAACAALVRERQSRVFLDTRRDKSPGGSSSASARRPPACRFGASTSGQSIRSRSRR
jgi:hypothetical protein